MSKTTAKERIAFATTFLACAAFLVGAVRIWGVSFDKVVGFLGISLIFLLVIIGAALLVVGLLVLYRRIKSKNVSRQDAKAAKEE